MMHVGVSRYRALAYNLFRPTRVNSDYATTHRRT
jgi:hypothetical protein